MGRGVFLQVHCGHCPRMRCLICARPCCCACLWVLDMCTAAWIIEASHAVRVQQALLALSPDHCPSVLFSLFVHFPQPHSTPVLVKVGLKIGWQPCSFSAASRTYYRYLFWIFLTSHLKCTCLERWSIKQYLSDYRSAITILKQCITKDLCVPKCKVVYLALDRVLCSCLTDTQ